MTLTLTYLGHSGILLSDGKHTLCVDPFLTGNGLATHRPDDIECDVIAFTHGHADHFNDDGLSIAQRTEAMVIAPYELANYCIERGLYEDKVQGTNPGGRVDTPFGYLATTPAVHSSSYEGRYMGVACGYVIHFGDVRVYHAGDTALFSDMERIGEMVKPDVVLLPIGGRYTMTPALATRAAEMLQAKIAIPVHFRTFPQLGQSAEGFNPAGVDVRVLVPGESTVV